MEYTSFQTQPQTFALKVDLSCCKLCPKRAERLLLQTDGVNTVSIDVEDGIVKVTGTIDPDTLIKKFETAGKKAELWSPPNEAKIKIEPLDTSDEENLHHLPDRRELHEEKHILERKGHVPTRPPRNDDQKKKKNFFKYGGMGQFFDAFNQGHPGMHQTMPPPMSWQDPNCQYGGGVWPLGYGAAAGSSFFQQPMFQQMSPPIGYGGYVPSQPMIQEMMPSLGYSGGFPQQLVIPTPYGFLVPELAKPAGPSKPAPHYLSDRGCCLM